MIKAYYLLTKPGIIYSNAFCAAGGFLLAARGNIAILLFLAMLVGLSLVIASACVFNNYIDQDIDSKMSRTQKRALVKKTIPAGDALMYGTILGSVGFSLLYFYTNPLTAFIGFIGFFFYVVVYSIGKRKTVHGTLLGSISGAVPPVVGYCAVTNHFDITAFLLFLILVVWQMPHFYAIAIFRKDDYAAASLPVLPVRKSIEQAKMQIVLYIIAFIMVSSLLTFFHFTGYSYLIGMMVVGIIWLLVAIQGFRTHENLRWARKVFFFSLVVILVFSLLLCVNAWLP